MTRKTNQEQGIYRIEPELTPIFKQLEENGTADITHIPPKQRTRLGQIAKHTCTLHYEKRHIIKAQKPIKILSQNTEYTRIQTK